MLRLEPQANPPRRLADQLTAAERRRFVGRDAEVELFRRALVHADPPFAVLHVHGPGGVGKSALLRECARVARDEGRDVVLVDGHSVDPTPAAFLAALGDALDRPLVLFVDTYERLAVLDAWLRDTLLPQLCDGSLVVLAGREPPAPAWTVELSWGALSRVLPLRNLRPAESRTLLASRGVPDAQHDAVLAFTHGHPLALSLVADVVVRTPGVEFRPQDAPDVVRLLLEQLVAAVPGPRHRLALETSAHVRVTTEPLLAAVLGGEPVEAHALFEWLRGLCFTEQGPEGLYPHDVVRELLDVDFRWRDPDGYGEMHRRVWAYLKRRVRETEGRAQQRAFFDKLYLHRNHPVAGLYHDYATLGTVFAEPATPHDHAAIVALIRRHEGDASAAVAAHWLRRRPEAFAVHRTPAGELSGVVASLPVHDATDDDLAADPAVRAARDHVRAHAPLRAGEEMLYHRFHLERDRYQRLSSNTNLLAQAVSLAPLQRPRLAWSFLPFAEPDRWAPLMRYIDFAEAPDAAFTLGGRRFGVFAHDWRAEPFDVWWDLEAKRSMGLDAESACAERATAPPLVVLSEPDFASAVRQALRDYARPRALADNPLLRSRVAIEAASAAGGPPGPETLRALLRDAADALSTPARDAKFHRAVVHTYLQPAASQERAAERLGLSFSTYRYHLARGTERVVDWLWHREIDGAAR